VTSALDRFRELLRIQTVSAAADDADGLARFDEFHRALARLYPATHAALELDKLAGHSLLYRWPGASADDPLVLMAHQDVVPVVPAEWEHEPFTAEVVGTGSDARVVARGAIDDKGALVAVLEAVESLVIEGFSPSRDVYLAFGHNEETAGDGAGAIVDRLRSRGVRPGLVLDEGGAVVDGVLPGVQRQTAMIGVAERGIMTAWLTAREAGGHASTPPAMPATARLARAVVRLQRRPFPRRISPPVRAMLTTAAPHAPQPLHAIFRSLAVTGPLVAAVFSRLGAETNALVRTTAVATELHGSPGENVLATTARAAVNIRLLTGDTVASVTARLRRVIADESVEIDVQHASDPSPVSPWKGEPWQRLSGAIATALAPDIVALPYIQLGASDSRWFTAISAHVYRFTPFHLTRAERDALHAHNESIRVDVWMRGIGFYRDLISAS
jgi:carboxypeptidase PM20D1